MDVRCFCVQPANGPRAVVHEYHIFSIDASSPRGMMEDSAASSHVNAVV